MRLFVISLLDLATLQNNVDHLRIAMFLSRRSATIALTSLRPIRHFTPTRPPPLHIEIETFGRLSPWATEQLASDEVVSVLVRHHERYPYKVQRALLAQISDHERAKTHVIHRPIPEHSGAPVATLDLTNFETPAGLIFLFWLFNRRLPHLQQDAALALPEASTEEEEGDVAIARRERNATFTAALIESWRLGSSLSAPRFQNDLLTRCATLLEQDEFDAIYAPPDVEPLAISWARRAFDGTLNCRHTEMREFAVDVAAKRVYDVGMSAGTLTPRERLDLSSCERFAAEVFGSLGAQIGTKGVGVRDFARAYLVEE